MKKSIDIKTATGIIPKMKLYYGYTRRNYKRIPVIRLAGNYLAKSNFKIGDCLEITLNDNHIVISKPKDLILGLC